MKYRRESGSRLVYSTEPEEARCTQCGEPKEFCRCRSYTAESAGDGVVRVRREVKGRKGKTVTSIAGIQGSVQTIDQIASDLKRYCGSGGSAKDGIILIQGDHREKIRDWLENKGYKVKLAGG